MPVSPQDFELYSRMTGAPMPTDAMSRMQMAPDVYNFTKSFARKPNLFEKTGNLIKNIGRGAVMALGAPLVAASEAENARMQEQLRNKADVKQSEAVTMEDPVEEVAPEPELTAVEKGEKAKRETAKFKTDEMIRLEKVRAKLRNIADKKLDTPIDNQNEQEDLNRLAAKVKSTENPRLSEIFARNFGESAGSIEVEDAPFQEPTTADSYKQDYVPNQTASNVVDRKISQGSQIADSTPNIAEVLSENQDSQPPEGMVGGEGKNQLAKFLSQKGLDQALLGAIGERMTPEPRIGDSSPLLDHPDIVGGEDDVALPGGTNTSPTQDLSSFHKEMRKMDAMERNKEAIDEVVDKFKNMSPSERQTMLGTEGIDSPNEMQGRITAAEESTNKLLDVAKAMGGEPSKEQKIEADQANSRILQKTAAKNRLAGRINEKFYPTDVARTDIQVGGMVDRKTGLGKSVGISYTPMNGNTKVGFNIMNDPTKPREVSTFDFVAPPETMESLQSQGEEDLGSKTFGKLFNMARQKKQGFSGLEM